MTVNRTDTSGEPQSKVEWELATFDDQGVTKSHSVREVGLGRYTAAVPVTGSENLTLRLRDAASDKTKVLHYDRPYPLEYSLSQTENASLVSLPEIETDSIRSGLEPIRIRRSAAHWFYLAAIVFLLCGNLVRRI